MKSTITKITILVIALFAVGSTYAQSTKPYQDPKYGVDSATRMQCIVNMSLYKEFYKQNNFKDAYKPWREVFENCPKASKNTYIHGATIYKNLIAHAKDENVKNAYVDTLMMIYDQRIEYFKQEAIVLGYKGIDVYSYKGKSAAKESNDYLKKSIGLLGENGKSVIISTYMQTVVDLYKEEKIGAEGVINSYTFSIENLDAIKKHNEKVVASADAKRAESADIELEKIETVYGNVEALFSESGAANCEDLVAIFKPAFEENAENLEWIKKVTKLLDNTECTDSPFYAKAAEQQYKLEPNAEAAHNLARLFLKAKKYEKAEGYYEEAAKLQEDAVTKALYYYEWSTLAFSQKQYNKVRDLARKALESNPNDGRPYLQIGLAYASSKGIGATPVEYAAVFWVAVDKFYTAKSVDPETASKAQEYISTYSKYFPNSEEWFMAVGTKAGDSYQVGGWIGETTKVRF